MEECDLSAEVQTLDSNGQWKPVGQHNPRVALHQAKLYFQAQMATAPHPGQRRGIRVVVGTLTLWEKTHDAGRP